MGKALRIVLGVVAIAVSIGCVINVYGDDAAVRSEAEAVACPRGCANASGMRVERSPFAETVSYDMPGGSVTVSCMRAAVIVGPYSCKKE